MDFTKIIVNVKKYSNICTFSENQNSFSLDISYNELIHSDIKKTGLYDFFMTCYWLSTYDIPPNLKVSIIDRGTVLFDFSDGWPPLISTQLFQSTFLSSIKNCNACSLKASTLFTDLTAAMQINELKEKKVTATFEILADLITSLCPKCLKNLKLHVKMKIVKSHIEDFLEISISKSIPLDESALILFWLSEQEFLNYLKLKNPTPIVEYLSGATRNKFSGMPLVIIPNSTLQITSKFLYIGSSWDSPLVISGLIGNHDELQLLYNHITFLPPSVFFQDEILHHDILMEHCWKVMIYVFFRMINDDVTDINNESLFEIKYDLLKKKSLLHFQNDSIILGTPKKEISQHDIAFSSLKKLNEKFTERLDIPSFQNVWKMAYKEIIDLKMEKILEPGIADKIITMYDRLVEKAFDEEFKKLDEFLIKIGSHITDILDQMTKTMNSISSEVNNSSLTVFGALIIQIIAILSDAKEIIWFLSIFLITLFIGFYIPMANKKINGFITALNNTRRGCVLNIINTFKILHLPSTTHFLEIRRLFKNLNYHWKSFKRDVHAEIRFLQVLSTLLYILLIGLLLLKFKFFPQKNDWLLLLVPIITVGSIPLWKKYFENEYPKGFSVYKSRYFALIHCIIFLIYAGTIFLFQNLNIYDISLPTLT